MFVATKNSHASPKVTNRSYLLSLLVAVVFALTINLNKIRAQIFNDVRINVPSQLHARFAKHPVGEYCIHVLNRWDPNRLQIGSADGQTSTPFQVDEHGLNICEERTVGV